MASVLLVAGNSALKAALRAKAQTMASQIQTACMAYYNDYSVYPFSTNPAPTTQVNFGTNATAGSTDEQNWGPLIYALCGNLNPYNPTQAPSTYTPSVPNTRSIAYLSLNRSSIDANGIPLNPIAPTTPSYFNISMDPTYSGILSNVLIFSPGSMTTNQMTGGVYVWANCNSSNSTNVNWFVHSP
ncbi:MAG: hypothetical protein LV481_00345 [Methylacidiphilales bacterium]|nr:hypothetical protein [Candidatus Methylacidiphilales bacterium]